MSTVGSKQARHATQTMFTWHVDFSSAAVQQKLQKQGFIDLFDAELFHAPPWVKNDHLYRAISHPSGGQDGRVLRFRVDTQMLVVVLDRYDVVIDVHAGGTGRKENAHRIGGPWATQAVAWNPPASFPAKSWLRFKLIPLHKIEEGTVAISVPFLFIMPILQQKTTPATVTRLSTVPTPTAEAKKAFISEVCAPYEKDESGAVGEPIDGKEITVSGQVATVREFGKRSIVYIKDVSGTLQLDLHADHLPHRYWDEVVPNIEQGAFVRARGLMAWAPQGELSLIAKSIEIEEPA